ncbi:exosporium leader peptide-containing protein [Bacillus toyonensis]|nr:exosporium leader peptide-containing protein [Bacillus toyonensis]MCU5582878.1 exosporium leader peptide-containing protein [Bacillus toyonensis]
MDEFLSSVALNPGSIGPTLPPIQPFQFPTGPTGSTGATGSTGPTGPTGTIVQIYGSLINAAGSAVNNTNIIFMSQGPFNGVTLNTVDNSITINSSGIYNVSFNLTMISLSLAGALITAEVLLTQNDLNTDFIFSWQTVATGSDILSLSRTDQLSFNSGDVLRCRFVNVNGNFNYTNGSLTVTKIG